MGQIYQWMKAHHVSYQGISWIIGTHIPSGKDTIYRAFNSNVEQTAIPPVEDIQIE